MLIDKKEAAKSLGCKEQAVGWMAKYHILHWCRVGGRMIFDQKEIDDLPYTYDSMDLSNENSIKLSAMLKRGENNGEQRKAK